MHAKRLSEEARGEPPEREAGDSLGCTPIAMELLALGLFALVAASSGQAEFAPLALDSFFEARPDSDLLYVKVDVEGGEWDVLRGMRT